MKKTILLTVGIGMLCLGLAPLGWARATAREVACRIELDREVLPAGTPQTAVLKITLDAPDAPTTRERPPVNLAIVLDRSGSMSGRKLEKAKEAAIEALRRLDSQDLFSLVIYDNNIETIVPAQSAANTEWIETQIRRIRTGGNTALFGGVSQGAAEIRKHLDERYIHRIILLSDGIANVGPSAPRDLGRLGASLVKENISVTTVGVGTDYNEDLMTRLAEQSDGNTYFVEDSRDLPRIFAAELGDVLSVVASKVIINLECDKGVRPVRVIGRDGRISKHGVEVELNQLYGGQEKYVLVEVEVPAGKEDEVRHIASADCSYKNALTQKKGASKAKVVAKFSRREEEVVASANKKVQEEILYNRIALSKDKAVELWDEGKRDDAVEELRRARLEAQMASETYDLPPQVAREAEKLEQDADELEDVGMQKKTRKSFRASSYKTRTQQSSY